MTDGEGALSQLVVVGCSAGGIDALSTLVATLPRDFPAPIVVAQHLDPRRPSHLREILTARSNLPVKLVEEPMALAPGVIFVVPSNRHVEISDHQVTVSEEGDAAPRPSVNRLFTSAAEAYGEGLIAVIMSGTGSDGAAGARHVKEMGGTVIIQNPETASFPAMPQSLAPSTVDMICDLEAIGGVLSDLARGSLAPGEPDDDRLLRSFLGDLRERSGIDFASYKRPTIMRRLQRRMAATGTARLDNYVRYVHQHPEEFQRLTSSFLIKVTEFFRDADLFEHLRTDILPELIESARSHDNELRIWSAGCATGEEAYSIAILLSEALRAAAGSFRVRIFATDLDADAVSYARRGIYPGSALANVPADLIQRYFTEVGGDFEINKQVRSMAVFGQHDLGQRAPFPRIDLTLCRNVLMYFTPDLQRRALQLFAFSLRDEGYLILGKAETTRPLADHFVQVNQRLKIYRRHGQPVLIPPARIRDQGPMVPFRPRPGRAGWVEAAPERPKHELERNETITRRAESLLMDLPVGIVTVDGSYDVQRINNAARRLLAIHAAAVGSDFVHLAAVLPPRELRHSIDAAFHDVASAHEYEVAAADGLGGRRCLEVSVLPHRSAAEAKSELVAIVVTDVTEAVLERRRLSEDLAAERARAEQLGANLAQLGQSYAEVLAANQELATSNGELRTSNEELQVANEEVQAATEEVETLNEELQATNEELETLNEELQATVEELNTTNDDLEARTVELQDLFAALGDKEKETEAARARLDVLLRSIAMPILVVDELGRRMLANPAFEEILPANALLEDASGRSLGGPTAIEVLAAGAQDGMELVFSVASGGRGKAWYLARAVPVCTDGVFAGSIVAFEKTDAVGEAPPGPAGKATPG